MSKSIIQIWQFESKNPTKKVLLFSDLFYKMMVEKRNEGLKKSTIKSYEIRFLSKKFHSVRNKDIKNITISDILNVLDKYSSF